MANVKFLWDGRPFTDISGTTFAPTKTPTGGSATTGSLTITWSGSGLTYDPALALPRTGTLTAYSERTSSYTFEITALNLTIHPLMLNGSAYNIGQMLTGTDNWVGDAGNNHFFFYIGGSDTYDGLAGIDTFRLTSDNRSTVPITRVDPQTLSFNVPGLFGTSDTVRLKSIERIKFADLSVAYDLDGNAGKVARVLGAVFGKAAVANETYAGIGLDLFDRGASNTDVMHLALQARLGATYSNTTLIQTLYRNVFNAEPSALDLQIFDNLLASRALTPEELGWAAADSALNAANIDLTGLQRTGLEFIPVGG